MGVSHVLSQTGFDSGGEVTLRAGEDDLLCEKIINSDGNKPFDSLFINHCAIHVNISNLENPRKH